MAVKLKTAASKAASAAANNARITAANTRAGATVAQQNAANASALASMNQVRTSQGLAPQTEIGVPAAGRTNGALSIDKATNEIKDASGTVVGKGSSLNDALAKQTQLSSGAAPTVAGRPDLFAVAPGANQEVRPFLDASTNTMVTPKTATAEQMAQVQNGTLDSFNKAQGLSYLDGKTFSELQPHLNESDLIRGPNGQIWLKQGLTADQVRARAATSVTGTSTGVTGGTTASEFTVDVPDTISTDTITQMTETPVTETDFNNMLAGIQVKQSELLALMTPGADEQATKAQINDIKAQVEKSLTELSMGLNNVEDQPIAMQFITGQQASIQRSADAKLQNLARIETNLLNELGLEQDARKVKASVAETQLGYLQTNLDTAFKVKQMIQQEEDSVFNRARALKSDAQATFATILDTMKGINESDMSAEQQKQLQDMSIAAGIPYSLVVAGLKNVRNQMESAAAFDYAKLTASTQNDGWAGSSVSAAGRVKDSKYLTDAEKLQSDFAQNPVVQNYAKQQEGFEYASTFDKNSTNPYDDQSLVFAFMKVLDPTSVVREGEYTTAQKNTGLLEQMGVKLSQVLDPQGKVLGTAQRENMLNAIQSRQTAAKTTFDSVASQMSATATGFGIDPSDVITQYGSTGDYGAGDSGTGDSGGFIPINASYDSVEGMLRENPKATSAVSALRSKGWTDSMILEATRQNDGLGFNNVGGDTNQAASTGVGMKTLQNGSPLEIAKSYLGLNAGNPAQAHTLAAFFKKAGGVDLNPATTAWCAAFANSVLGAAGLKETGSQMAQSFLSYGTAVRTPTKGDIVVFERGAKGSGLGHVGFVVGVNPNGTLQVLGGNQSNKISVETFKTSRVLGYRRIKLS